MRPVPRGDLTGWAFFSGLHLLNALFHRQWADELQAWSLVRQSSTLTELHWNVSQDGHPPLWYLTLWPLRFLTGNPGAQQVVSCLCALLILGLLWTRSPFNRSEKVLLSFSFQMGYVMSVVSRSYVLGTLLIFLFVALKPRYKERPRLGWALLALLCNVHILYAPMTFCLALVWIESAEPRANCLTGLWIYFLGVYWCSSVVLLKWSYRLGVDSHLLTLLPAAVVTITLFLAIRGKPGPRAIAAGGWAALLPIALLFSRSGQSKAQLMAALSNMGRSVIPVVNPFQQDYWHLGLSHGLGAALAVVSCLTLCWYFRPQPFLLALLGLQAAFLLLVSAYLIPGQPWHAGTLFTGMLGLVWWARRAHLALGPEWLLLIIFVPQAMVGTNAMIRSKWVPISSSYATAEWIRSHEIPPERLMGFSIFPTLGVATYLQEPIYFPEMNRKTALYDWRSTATPDSGAKLIVERMQRLGFERAYLVAPEGAEAIRASLAARGVKCQQLFLSPGSLRGKFQVWELQFNDSSSP